MSVLPLHKKKELIWQREDRYLYLHKPTGMYYARAKIKGKKPLFKSTGYTSKGKAKTKAMIMVAEWMGTRRSQSMDCILFGEFAETYIDYAMKTKIRPRTKENLQIYIKELITEMGHENIRHINEGFFDEWLADFKARKDRTTFMDYAKYLSKVLRHAHRKGLIDRMPEIRNPDAPKSTGRVYTHDEVRRLIESSDDRLQLQIRLCLQSFMRLREMLFLEVERIEISSGLIRLGADNVKTGSKTGEGREFFVNKTILKLIKEQISDSPFLFPSPNDPSKPTWSNKTAWLRAKKKAGIKGKARWHDLRHTAITWALTEKQMNPLMVSAYAGVSLRTIQKVYLKVKPEHTKEIATCIEI